jgi:hypothetical protein
MILLENAVDALVSGNPLFDAPTFISLVDAQEFAWVTTIGGVRHDQLGFRPIVSEQ